MPRARRSGVYMSPAAVRISSDVAMPTPISTSPASSAGTDDVRVASAFNAHPLESATNPTTSTGRRPCLSIVRPAITAVTPDDVRKMAGPRPNSPAWPVTSTKVSVDTAAASCSTTELTALVVDRSSVFRRITGARSVVICSNPRTGRRIIASEGMPEKASAELAAAGRTLVLSNPAKTFFPERGETKLDLANYYLAIEQPLMRALERARLAADHHRADAQRHALAGAGCGRRRPHRVGREPRLHRPARVALPGGLPRPHR